MKTTHLEKALFTLVALCIVMGGTAEAYPSKIHIYIANQIARDLAQSREATGVGTLTLLGPDGSPRHQVRLADEDVSAILENLEYFRGGSVGPDNTPLPGLTDPTHAWGFSPYGQCQMLLELAETPEERAYALGCFAHGLGDNAVHHVVNYFSGQAFTFYPIANGPDDAGELEQGFINAARHMMVERNMVEAAERMDPAGFAPDQMRHRIALGLVERTYWSSGDEDRGFWHWFTRVNGLVARKNEALQAARLEGFDPSRDLDMTIEQIRESGATVDFDAEVVEAYGRFLRDGGSIPGYRDSALTPADYVILLPEIIEDIRRLLAMQEASGRNRVEADYGEDCSLLSIQCRFYRHLYAPLDGGPSRFQQAVDQKNVELDGVIRAYLQAVENLSNLLVGVAVVTEDGQTLTGADQGNGHGGASLSPATISAVLSPLRQALRAVTEFPAVLFPEWMQGIMERLSLLRGFLDAITDLVREQLVAMVVDRVEEELNLVRDQLAAAAEEAFASYIERFEELRASLGELVDAEKLRMMGLDLSSAEELYSSFLTSVLYMNSYNGIAAVLANPEVVFADRLLPTGARQLYTGPTSFDASFQLEYTQLALCDGEAGEQGYREVFFPCGVSVGEMLQGDYRTCRELPPTEWVEPRAECFLYSNSEFALNDEELRGLRAAETRPPFDSTICQPLSLETLVDGDLNFRGSPTLSFPPELLDPAVAPVCANPVIRGITVGDGPADGWAHDGAAEAAGCNVASRGPSSPTLPLALALALGFALAALRRLP